MLILQGLVVHVEYLWNQWIVSSFHIVPMGFFLIFKKCVAKLERNELLYIEMCFFFHVDVGCVFLFTDFIQLPSLPEHVSHFLFPPDFFAKQLGLEGGMD